LGSDLGLWEDVAEAMGYADGEDFSAVLATSVADGNRFDGVDAVACGSVESGRRAAESQAAFPDCARRRGLLCAYRGCKKVVRDCRLIGQAIEDLYCC
jgi:hypothetical protein